MTDPIAGDSLQKAAKAAQEMQQQQDSTQVQKPGGENFDAVMDKVAQPPDSVQASEEAQRAALKTDFQTQVDQMPAEERAKVETEFQTKVAKLEQPEQARFYAQKLDESNRGLVKLERACHEMKPSPFKMDVVGRLDDLRANYGDLDKFMNEFANGKSFSQSELLAMQIRTHQMAQSVELLSKTVEHTVGGMKTIFQTNV